MPRKPSKAHSKEPRRKQQNVKAQSFLRGFSLLPEEVLANILERLPSTLNFQLACRAFRTRVVSMPTLWTHVSIEQNPEYSIQRSKNCGLHIVIRLEKASFSSDRICLFLLLLEPHYLRWESFSITGYIGARAEELILGLEDLYDRFQHRTFPSLRNLSVRYTFVDYRTPNWPAGWNEKNGIDRKLAQKNFFSTWNMPSLATLELDGLVPQSINGSPTYFSFLLNSRPPVVCDSTRLLHLLQSFAGITELSLEFSIPQITTIEHSIHIELLALRKLAFSFQDANLPWLLKAFSAPNLTELSIYHQTDEEGDECAEAFFKALFPVESCRWPRLERLYIDIVGWGWHSALMDMVLTRLPNISMLKLCCVGVSLPTTIAVHTSELRLPSESPFPPLRSLKLSSIGYYTGTLFLVSIRELFSSPMFEKLEIEESEGVLKNVVRSILPPEKTLIYDGEEVPAILI